MAAQRGWPQRTDSRSPQRSSDSATNTDDSTSALQPSRSAETLGNTFVRDQILDESQPLEVGKQVWGYHSTSGLSIQSLVPVERESSFRGEAGGGGGAGHGVEDDIAYELETPRNVRGPSTAYDLSEMSTEEEVRTVCRACHLFRSSGDCMFGLVAGG